jgi:hypothetical protein
MLLQQIHAAWQTCDIVASLLSLDKSGAYDRVVPAWLLHNLRRSLPTLIVNFISSFRSEGSTSLQLPRFSSTLHSTYFGIPQGSPLSPIWFLFYSPNLPITPISFVDEVNFLAFCKTLREHIRL